MNIFSEAKNLTGKAVELCDRPNELYSQNAQRHGRDGRLLYPVCDSKTTAKLLVCDGTSLLTTRGGHDAATKPKSCRDVTKNIVSNFWNVFFVFIVHEK